MRLSEFLSVFFNADETIFGRALKPKKCPQNLTAQNYEFTIESLAKKEVQDFLRELNRHRGMYFVVNAGGHSDIDVHRFNAAFCEIDTIPIAEQHDLYDNASLPPSIRVETKKSVHAYWLLNEIITPSEFYLLQKGLIENFKSDGGIHNASRLMRLPFFNHLSYEADTLIAKKVEIQTFTNNRFSFGELSEAYPFELPERKENNFKNFNANGALDDARAEVIARIEQSRKFKKYGKFGYTTGLCHDGQASDTALYVNYANGFVGCFMGCPYTRIADALGVTFKR